MRTKLKLLQLFCFLRPIIIGLPCIRYDVKQQSKLRAVRTFATSTERAATGRRPSWYPSSASSPDRSSSSSSTHSSSVGSSSPVRSSSTRWLSLVTVRTLVGSSSPACSSSPRDRLPSTVQIQSGSRPLITDRL